MNVDALARAVTRAGMILLESGAETYRVEDTMRRIALAYGASTVDSYATPTLLIISFSLDGQLIHNIKRTQIKSVDLTKIDKINELSRMIQVKQMSVDDFTKQLIEIENGKTYSNIIQYLAAGVCTFGFAFFFGGNFNIACIAFLLGFIVKVILSFFDQIQLNSYFKYILSGGFVSASAIMMQNLNIIENMDILIISVIMLLVPGLAITNAIRDTMNGDITSGTARAIEAFLIAVSIAVGTAIAFMMLGGY